MSKITKELSFIDSTLFKELEAAGVSQPVCMKVLRLYQGLVVAQARLAEIGRDAADIADASQHSLDAALGKESA